MATDARSATKRPAISRKRLLQARQYKLNAYDQFEQAKYQQSHDLKTHCLNHAKKDINQSLYINPNDGDSFNLLARIELDQGQFKNAQRAITSALNIHPRNGGFHYSAGHIALAMLYFDDAEVSFKKAIKYAPKETRADVSLAYTLAEAGKNVEAFCHYRELAKTQGHDVHIRSRLLECSSGLTADYYDPELEQDLLSYLKWDNMNRHLLASLVSSLLECKFQLNQDGSAAQFDDMANCPLLLSALRHTLIKSELLEKLIMALRHELLCYATKKGQIPNEYTALCEAIAHYGLAGEYILPDTDAEQNMITMIKGIIDQSLEKIGCTPIDISGALLLLAMYETWLSLNNFKTLMAFPDESWPAISFDIKKCHDEYLTLKAITFDLASNMPSQAEHQVKAQYEEHPYPRWSTLDYKNSTNYANALKHEYPNLNIPSHLKNNELNILIAGCGTGRHALNVAKYFNNVKVLALDISQNSLAYAQYKAKKLGIHNIQFNLSDLTQLKDLSQASAICEKFNIIECSGVLHHIKQYKKALNNLLLNLKPNGLIKISLYSERARKNVVTIRKLFKPDDSKLSDHKIKVIRQAIFQCDSITDKNSIIKSDDFYSLSGTVDLLFHEYEERFSPLSIKKLCQEHQLKWLGFSNLGHDIKQKFIDFQGEHYNFENLNQWEEFEEKYPDTFSKMYQFYCQYEPKLILK